MNKNSNSLDLTLIYPTALMARNRYSTITQPPLRLAYLSAVALEKGYSVDVVDAVGEAIIRFAAWDKNDQFITQGLSINDIIDKVNPKTNFIGIICMFTRSWSIMRRLINCLRESSLKNDHRWMRTHNLNV